MFSRTVSRIICTALVLAFAVLSAISAVCADFPEQRASVYVYDSADVISSEIEDDINRRADALYAMGGAQIITVCVTTTGDTPIDKYTAELFNTWKIGSVQRNNGMLLIMATEDREYWILQGNGIKNDITDSDLQAVNNECLEQYFRDEKYGEGALAVFDRLLAEHDRYRWDFVQIQLNYVDWRHAKEVNTRNTDAEYLYGELSRRGIPAVIMEPLLGGRLSNVHDHIAAKLRQRRPEQSVASWAFRFAGSFPGVLTVLSGMTYMEHLQDNLRTFSPLDELTDADREFLEETAQALLRYPTIPCNDCKYCMPCPYGLDIPGILLHFNKCINEGRMPSSSRDSAYRQARRAFLVGYDRSVPRLRQADHCIGCNQCVPHCPQNIDIPAQMQRIDRFVENLKQNREF